MATISARRKVSAKKTALGLSEDDEKQQISNILNEMTDVPQVDRFSQLPLSCKVLKGLDDMGFVSLTKIQGPGIFYALKDRDVLGLARTGSGKTLSFVIPILEKLWKCNWTKLNGLGALIISPTRELSFQTFRVIQKVGKYFDFSAGLIIGGKDIDKESTYIRETNILVATPGRLLQHLEQTANYYIDDLKVLVLDETDKILDLGFENTMKQIFRYLPENKQTLLYSATLTSNLDSLAYLSLKNHIILHPDQPTPSIFSIPPQCNQFYVRCKLYKKLNMLYSFLTTHRKSKILIFFTCCKQVKFVFQAFSHLQPGIPLIAIHGSMSQTRRLEMYQSFCQKKIAALISTDISARGLDFPDVKWVIQVDYPQDIASYVHRIGRTARCENQGSALLFVTPPEKASLDKLKDSGVKVEEISFRVEREQSIHKKLEDMCARNTDLKESAQRAIVAYSRSIYLSGGFRNMEELIDQWPLSKLARSYGLMTLPQLYFLPKNMKKKSSESSSLPIVSNKSSLIDDKNFVEAVESDLSTSLSTMEKSTKTIAVMDGDVLVAKKPEISHRNAQTQKLQQTMNNSKLNKHSSGVFLIPPPSVAASKPKYTTKAAMVKRQLKDSKLDCVVNKKMRFDEEGKPMEKIAGQILKSLNQESSNIPRFDIVEAKNQLKLEDRENKLAQAQRIKERNKKLRMKRKLQNAPQPESDEELGEEDDECNQNDESCIDDTNQISLNSDLHQKDDGGDTYSLHDDLQETEDLALQILSKSR